VGLIDFELNNALFILDTVGIIAFVLGGFIIAKKKKLDILGVYIITLTSSLMGGMIRDIVVDKTPVIFTIYYPIIVALITTTVLILAHKYIKEYENKKMFVFTDGIGLCTFSVVGSLQGISSEFNIFGVLFLGLLNAVGGGMIRDIMLGNIPVILRDDFYATIALIVSILIYFLFIFDRLFFMEILFVILIGIIIRIISIYKNISLPKL